MCLKRRALLILGGWTMAVSAASGHNRSGSLFNGDLLADYFQIYVRDHANADLPAAYSEEAIAARLVGVHTPTLYTPHAIWLCRSWWMA